MTAEYQQRRRDGQRTGQQQQRRRQTQPPIRERLRNKRVVTIGGGTGPFALLSQLKHHPCAITAIVSMADSGGSSRRLMDEFGQLPLGDLRQALVALSRKGRLWRDLFAYRFREVPSEADAEDPRAGASAGAGAGGVGGHSLGNLMLSALQKLDDDNLLWAIQDAQELLETAGAVLPVTLEHATLVAELDDGSSVRTESEIDTRGEQHPDDTRRITRILLEDETPPCGEAIRAIRRADIIILGPGDLYTSVLPSLLVQGVAEAVRASEAQKVYVCNLMTKHGETDGFRASDFVAEVHHYLGGRVDRAILHDGSFPEDLIESYAAQRQYPVEPDVTAVERLVPDVAVDNLLAVHAGHLVRHDAERLLRAVLLPTLEF